MGIDEQLFKMKTKLAQSGADIFKKNKINRDLDADKGGSDYEQSFVDLISKSISKQDGTSQDDAQRRVTKGMRKIKTNKKTGERSFTI